MTQIKSYSSVFSTKLNYVLDLLDAAPIQYGRLKAIINLTGEKESTINNWLFNGKIPRDSKRLAISDALGVSYDYLFDDNVHVKDMRRPQIFFLNNYYLVPFVEEDRTCELLGSKIFRINKRFPIVFPGFEKLVNKFGSNIYVTQSKEMSFGVHISPGTGIIYSDNVILEDFSLIIHRKKNNKAFSVKRVIIENDKIFLEEITKDGKFKKTSIDKNDDFLSIILTYSN